MTQHLDGILTYPRTSHSSETQPPLVGQAGQLPETAQDLARWLVDVSAGVNRVVYALRGPSGYFSPTNMGQEPSRIWREGELTFNGMIWSVNARTSAFVMRTLGKVLAIPNIATCTDADTLMGTSGGRTKLSEAAYFEQYASPRQNPKSSALVHPFDRADFTGGNDGTSPVARYVTEVQYFAGSLAVYGNEHNAIGARLLQKALTL